jgi:hypothetical protein
LSKRIVLYLHYKRVAFEQHGAPIGETLRETKTRTGLSSGTILTARDGLESAGWLQVDKHGTRASHCVFDLIHTGLTYTGGALVADGHSARCRWGAIRRHGKQPAAMSAG